MYDWRNRAAHNILFHHGCIFYESAKCAKLKYDETKTYADKFPIGNPDVWNAPDLHKSRSKHNENARTSGNERLEKDGAD